MALVITSGVKKLCLGMIALLVSVPPVCAYGVEVRSAASGSWDAVSTWTGGKVPGDGDTIIVESGHSVSVKDLRYIGTSSDDKPAIVLKGTGRLVIAEGGDLRVRGNVTYRTYKESSATTVPAVTVQGGGRWRWDASKAKHPVRANFRFAHSTYRDSGEGLRAFEVVGTPERRAVIDSDPAGGNGYFSSFGLEYYTPLGLIIRARYADFSRLGSAAVAESADGPAIDPIDSFGLRNNGGTIEWDVSHSTFTECAAVSAWYLSSTDIIRHRNNIHTATIGSIFSAGLGDAVVTTGVREITENIFDASMVSFMSLPGFTITGNYMDGSLYAITWEEKNWKLFAGNFMRVDSYYLSSFVGVSKDSYLMWDLDHGNPHVAIVSGEMDGIVFSQAGGNYSPRESADSGEFLLGRSSASPVQMKVTRTLMLPNMYGFSSGEMTALGGGFENVQQWFDRNTWFGGFIDGFGFAFIQYSESGNTLPGQVQSFRSNILWNPKIPGKPALFSKMMDIGNKSRDIGTGPSWRDVVTGPTQDVVNPDNADYNASWGHATLASGAALAESQIPKYKNFGNGYYGNFSKTPGAHDVNASPEFFDYKRDVVLFDSKYLGVKPFAWSPSKTYKVGDVVSWSKGNPENMDLNTAYWGLPINFRYTNGPGCNGENREPLKGDNDRELTGDNKWRECWIWNALYELKEGVRTGRTFSDPAIGAENDTVIMTLIKWVRAGYAPTNPALKAAHDGGWIGAVGGVPAPGRYTITGPATGTVGTAATYTVTLVEGVTLKEPLTVTLTASGARGRFFPDKVTIAPSMRQVSFTFTPTVGGINYLYAENGNGFVPPVPLKISIAGESLPESPINVRLE